MVHLPYVGEITHHMTRHGDYISGYWTHMSDSINTKYCQNFWMLKKKKKINSSICPCPSGVLFSKVNYFAILKCKTKCCLVNKHILYIKSVLLRWDFFECLKILYQINIIQVLKVFVLENFFYLLFYTQLEIIWNCHSPPESGLALYTLVAKRGVGNSR